MPLHSGAEPVHGAHPFGLHSGEIHGFIHRPLEAVIVVGGLAVLAIGDRAWRWIYKYRYGWK